MSKFMLYAGLSYGSDREFKNLEEVEEKLMKGFNCDPSWPICLYDYTFKNKIPTYLMLRVGPPLTTYLISDYFSLDYEHSKNRTLATDLESAFLISKESLLIERNSHLCQFRKRFKRNFKLLYNSRSDFLFGESPLFKF